MIKTGIPCLMTTSFMYILASFSMGSVSLMGIGYGYSRKGTKRKPKPTKQSTEWKEQSQKSARYNLDVLPYFFPAKPLDTLAKIISSTLLTHPSCIKAMLAIPHLSQVSSMAEIDSKEAQMKSKAGICFRITSHNKHTS
ncbi:hypothetical protein Tco_0294276 [Tanacetum coccineum]